MAKICICGGGNLGHVVAGFVAAQGKHEVCIMTQRPERWNRELMIDTPDGKVMTGHISCISNRPEDVIPHSDIILLCLPGYAIADCLRSILKSLECTLNLPYVGSVVSSTGFFFEAMKILPSTIPLFGFQRVPFISRVIEYGHRARLKGYKDSLNLAVEHAEHPERLRDLLADLLQTPIQLLSSYYEASLSNSNPLLHPSRLYDLWSDWHEGITYARVPLFYEEWTEEAAQLYIDMDNELQALLTQLPVRKGSIATVLDYYESTDAASLARKLRSIEAFKGIPAPMKRFPSRETVGGDELFVPDFQSRYFTEDFPYGLAIIHRLLQEHRIDAPHIEKVYQWGLSLTHHM